MKFTLSRKKNKYASIMSNVLLLVPSVSHFKPKNVKNPKNPYKSKY